MNNLFKSLLLLGLMLFATERLALADTTWTAGAGTGTFSTAGNWNNGLPSTGPQLAIFDPNAPIRVLDITGTPRNSIGLRFDLVPGDNGFTFNSSATAANIGMQSRAGGINGIINNDDSTQTFNVPVRLFTTNGVAGAGAAQTFNAAAGDLVFSGLIPATSTNATVNNNGGTLTIAGAFNTTIGVPAGRGDIAGAGGLTKIGGGTLTLGGLLPNVYTGPTTISGGSVIAAKDNAFGVNSALTLEGGTLFTGGYDHSFASLDLNGNSTIDFGAGESVLIFGDSDGQNWSGAVLNILNYTLGSDTLRVGTDGTGFDAQLSLLRFADFGNIPGQVDANGYVTPLPEPGTWAFLLCGGLALGGWMYRRRRS